ncbi:MAG: glycosyltransferase [Burkholderiaceae bacterium]|jgi:glycosyltransferase involved in cell wall biosynthesis
MNVKEDPNTIERSGRVWLFIDLAESLGGHEIMLLRLIDEIQSVPGSITAVLCCLPGTRLALEASKRSLVLHTISPNNRSGPLGNLLFLGRLWRLLRMVKKAHAPEIALVAEGSLFAQRFGLYAAKLARLYTVLYIPLLSSFSSMGWPDVERLERKLRLFYGRLPNAWLAITGAQALEFRAWSGVRQPILTLPNTVSRDVEAHAGEALTRSVDSIVQPVRVLVLGRFDQYQKGLDLLLQYLEDHVDLAGEFVVHFVGEGSFAPSIEKARELGALPERLIQLEPWMAPIESFRRSDVLLIPSRYEGVPLVMLEAMSFGLPVFATDLPGTRAYLPTCCLFQLGDFDRAFACIRSLRRFKTRPGRIGRRNLVAFRQLASGEAFSSAVQALIGELDVARRS